MRVERVKEQDYKDETAILSSSDITLDSLAQLKRRYVNYPEFSILNNLQQP